MNARGDSMTTPYPDGPGFKGEGPSGAAAEKIRVGATRLGEHICALLLKSPPLTADEIAARLGHSILYVRPRVSELVSQGRVIDSGARGRNASGMTATKWTAG